jgi:alpha-ketoglutarate-dependent taurine dioxygenase
MLIRVLDKPLGAEVVGLSMSSLADPRTRQEIRDALFEHLVLIIRTQSLSGRDQDRLTRFFGDPAPTRKGHEHREAASVQVVESQAGEPPTIDQIWHADGSFLPRPPMVTVLSAALLPTAGDKGGTYFVDTRAAYDSLPASLLPLVRTGKLRFSYGPSANEMLAGQDRKTMPFPDIVHPLVRKHPVTGRGSLFLDQLSVVAVDGVSEGTGIELLKHLYAHTLVPQRMYIHEWTQGDVLIWDNSSLMHRRGEHDLGHRVMHRSTVIGPPPIPLHLDEPVSLSAHG